MDCPGCGGQMVEKSYEGVLIDRCSDCGGAWLDDREIRPIVDQKQKRFSAEKRIAAVRKKGKDFGEMKQILCPKCQKPMPAFQYAVNSGVFLNRCPKSHGLWLDRGELEQVQLIMEEYDQRYASFQPAGDLPTVELKRCPKCQEVLREVAYETEKIDLCPRCKGVWCDGAELGRIVESRGKSFTGEDHPDVVANESKARVAGETEQMAALNCVICGQRMQRLNYSHTSGIIIDRCPHSHGVWLDQNEVEKVQLFVERWESQRDRVSRQYADALNQARKESHKNYDEAIESIKVSRFGVVNRLVRSLARRGFFD